MKNIFIRYFRIVSVALLIVILGITVTACPGNDNDPYDEYNVDTGVLDDYVSDDDLAQPDDEGSLIDGGEESPVKTPSSIATNPPVEITTTELVTETLKPSVNAQQVSWNGQVTVTVPGRLLKNETPLTISRVETELPSGTKGFTPLSTYSVSLGAQHEFTQPLTIEIAYDPAQLKDQSAEAGLNAEYWDTDVNDWCYSPSQVDTQRNVVIIKTNHLTVWRIEQWSGGFQAVTDHFTVAWYWDQTSTINGTAQDKTNFARQIGDYLEAAWMKYHDAGFYVLPADDAEAKKQWEQYSVNVTQRGKTCVVLDAAYNESETSSWTGAIRLKTRWDSVEQVQHDTSHELFHNIHLRQAGMVNYLRSQWWADATADYASTRIAWDIKPGMQDMVDDFFQDPLTTADGIHNYAAAWFVDYLVSRGVQFKPLIDEMNNRAATTAALDAYCNRITGYSLRQLYSDFAAFTLFDSAGQIHLSAYNRGLLKGGAAQRGTTSVLASSAKDISFSLQIPANYCVSLWGFSLEAGSYPARTLKIELTAPIPDVLVNVYTQTKDERFPGGANRASILSSLTPSKDIIVEPGHVVYVLATNDSGSNVEVKVTCKAAAKQANVSGSIDRRYALDGPTGTYTIAGNWEVAAPGAVRNGGYESMPEVKVNANEPAQVTINLPCTLSVDAEQSEYTIEGKTYTSEYRYTVKSWSFTTHPSTYSATVSGDTLTANFTLPPENQLTFHFEVVIETVYSEYDSNGVLLHEYSPTETIESLELTVTTD
jgi:hypothetical protein